MEILDLIGQYNGKGRHYHNFLHVAKMFCDADRSCLQLTDAQRLAILYHDVVYVAGRNDNEEESVKYMFEHCENVTVGDFKIAKNIILDTKIHIPTIEQSKDIIDLDLISLGEHRKYIENSVLIRKEFSMLSDGEFRSGRIKWIESFLDRESVYVGFLKGTEYESNARANLMSDLCQLRHASLTI